MRSLLHDIAVKTSESQREHIDKFYGRHRLFRSVLKASKFAVLELIENVMLCVNFTIVFA